MKNVFVYRQLNETVRAHVRNPELRKQKYRKFWKIIDTKGAWRHAKYLRKKARLLRTDDLSTVWTIREVMPQCILDLVRGPIHLGKLIWVTNGRRALLISN